MTKEELDSSGIRLAGSQGIGFNTCGEDCLDMQV